MKETIYKQDAIDALKEQADAMSTWIAERYKQQSRGVRTAINIIEDLPSAQPEIIDEQAIDHLQKSGWMQNHDKQMYEAGLKERLADDSGSYDALLPSAQPEQRWIPCSERMPECEQEVLICTTQRVWVRGKTGKEIYEEPVITPALYEDGTMLEVNSKWCWEDIDYAGWDEEEDCGIIPEGWWENRYFNPDGVYNNVVDRKVIAWMPLPEPYKEEVKNDGQTC